MIKSKVLGARVEIELPRKKNLAIRWRILFVGYSAFRRLVPKKFLLIHLLNLNWLSNRLAYDQFFFTYKSLELLRPKNHEDFLMEIHPDFSVCDLGAGSGALTRKIADKCRRVTYLDSDSRMLQTAKESLCDLTNIDFQSSIDNLLRSKSRFDMIVMSDVLEHIQLRVEFLVSLQELTGKICIEIPDLDSSALNYARMSLGSPLWSDEDHVVEMNFDSLEVLLFKSGWRIVKSSVRGGTIFVVAETRVGRA